MSENENNNNNGYPLVTGFTLGAASTVLGSLVSCANHALQQPQTVEAASVETAPAPASKPAEAAALQSEGGYTARLNNGMRLVVGNGGLPRKVPPRGDSHQETAALRRRPNPGETKTPYF